MPCHGELDSIATALAHLLAIHSYSSTSSFFLAYSFLFYLSLPLVPLDQHFHFLPLFWCTMGNCISQNDLMGQARSDPVDQQIEADSFNSSKECKILLLGMHPSFHFTGLG